jgi:[DsrC]-trisulfide reductase subunit M
MNLILSLIAVLTLVLLAWGAHASAGLAPVFLVFIPYITFVIFLAGVAWRILAWARSPVPFRIPTTCGQEKSLPWVKAQPLENPWNTAGVIGRMALEVLLFRSLFRNTKTGLHEGRTVYGSDKWLWFFGLTFHWSLLVILIRHMRFFVDPVGPVIGGITALDGFFELGTPTLFLSDTAILAGVTFLFARRVVVPQLRYISLFTDYFALALIGAVAATGVLMRAFFPADLERVKTLALGWVSFSPVVPGGVSALFQTHLLLVCVLLAWFPFSKLMHAGGVFLSPTRNLANDSRMRRHVNPWDAPVKVHTYEEYEDEFRDQMKTAGLPVEKE